MAEQKSLSLLQDRAKYCVYQPFSKSYADVCESVANAAEIDLMEWQKDCLEIITAVGDDGKFIHKTVALSIPRQAGKSTLMVVYAIFLALVMGARVLWTAHSYSTTLKTLDDFRKILGAHVKDETKGIGFFNAQLLETSSKTAHEYFVFKNMETGAEGGSINFTTRSKSAKLGNTFDIIILDEAQEVTSAHTQILLPTVTSGRLRNPQFVYTGTPRRAGSLADKFEEIRQSVISDNPPADTGYIEFGLDEVGDITDETRWYKANPSLASGVANAAAIRAMLPPQLDRVAFAQECLGVWLSPLELTGDMGTPVIGFEQWLKCATSKAPTGDPVAFAVKFAVDGAAFAVVAAFNCNSKIHIELVDRRKTDFGKQALAQFIASRGQTIPFVIDGKSGTGAMVERLKGTVPMNHLLEVQTADVIAANESFKDAIEELDLSWFVPAETQVTEESKDALSQGVTESFKRKIGTGGGWGFDGEYADIAEAAALAYWQAQRMSKKVNKPMEVFF